MTQLTLDDALTRAARDEAIGRAERHASDDWKHRAYDAVREVCRTHESWIIDAVWATGLDKPAEPRALGAVVLQAARDGLCEKTREYRASAQPTTHGNPRVVWRSLIFEGVSA